MWPQNINELIMAIALRIYKRIERFHQKIFSMFVCLVILY